MNAVVTDLYLSPFRAEKSLFTRLVGA